MLAGAELENCEGQENMPTGSLRLDKEQGRKERLH